MKIIAIANQKGGVGKTTTSVNLSAALAEAGKSVLLIDFDPQANATSALGLTPEPGKSFYPVLLGKKHLFEQITTTSHERLWLLPSELDLAGSEIEIARDSQPMERLNSVLNTLHGSWEPDFILMDCPPSLGILMTNALAAADSILIPLQCEYFALEGLSKILHVIDQMGSRRQRGPLSLEGILLTMHDSRTNLSQQVVHDVCKHFDRYVYRTIIPRSVRISESPSYGKSILQHDPHGVGAESYRQLAQEVLHSNHKIATPSS